MKVSKLVAILILAGSIGVGVVACDNDDDKTNGPGEETPTEKPTHAYVCYQMTATKDMLSILDVKAVYTNASGQNDTVVMADSAWTKVIKVDIPFSGKVKPLFSRKNGFEPTKDKYKIGFGGGASYNYKGGESFGVNSLKSSVDCSANKLGTVIDSYLSKNLEWKVEVKE